MFNRQEIFDNAVRGVVEQGKPSMRDGGYGNDICAYRSDDGSSRCALGWSIPDEKYSGELMEGSTPGISYSEGPNLVACSVEATTQEDIQFLTDIQQCHDNFHCAKPELFVPMFIAGMTHVAAKYGLGMYALYAVEEKWIV